MKKIIYSAIMLSCLSINAKAQNWLTTGNAGLSGSNFIGTTDAVPFSIKVNNRLAGKIDFATTKANTSFGYQALKSNTAAGNTAFGFQSMFANTSGYANTSSGQYSMQNNLGGFSNTAFGSEALRQNVSGYFNTAIGQAALGGSTGNDNTAIGRYAFISLTTGSGNTALGSAANISDGTLSNVTLLGFYTTATASNSVQIGNDAVISVKAANNVVIVSDGRFKKNIKENVPGLTFINALKAVTYNYDIQGLDNFKRTSSTLKSADGTASAEALKQYNDAVSKKERILYSGFVAQDVEKAAQKLGYDFSGVYKPQNDKDAYGLSYAEFVVPLVKAVQELSKQNDKLQEQIDDLKKEIAAPQTTASAQADNAVAVQKIQLTGAALLQNTPNPFTHATTISYTLPQKYSNAKIVITDNRGRSIKEINVNGSGKGSIIVDASSLANGSYHYSLIADGKVMGSKQMLLSK